MAFDVPNFVKKLPPPKGTAPVVKWALGIRLKKAEELQKMGIRVIMLALRPHIRENDLESLNCTTRRNILQLVNSVACAAVSCPEAPWWLVHRDEPAHSWLPDAWQRCLDHYRKTQPWK